MIDEKRLIEELKQELTPEFLENFRAYQLLGFLLDDAEAKQLRDWAYKIGESEEATEVEWTLAEKIVNVVRLRGETYVKPLHAPASWIESPKAE